MPEDAEIRETIENVVYNVLSGVSTAFPGTIVAPLPPLDGLVNVQPNHRYRSPIDNSETLPSIVNNAVLVYNGRTKQTISRPPRESLIGSKVLVLACEHSLTEWRSSKGASVYPQENRIFDKNDSIAILGLYPETIQWTNPQMPNTWEFLGREGTKFKIGTSTADLCGIIYQVLLLMSAGVDPDTGIFLSLAQITPLITKLLTIVNPQIA